MRVTRCFAFLDLCGFTSYTETYGDTAAVSVLAQLRATLRAEAERHGVRVTKWLGDGAMLSGVDSDAVLECCRRVRDSVAAEGALPLRAGICTGAVIMFEGDDYIGDAVNRASRLCDLAEPWQVLVQHDELEVDDLAPQRGAPAERTS
jgi:class 3 adenylate cyclase